MPLGSRSACLDQDSHEFIDAPALEWIKQHDNGRFGHFINGRWAPPAEGQYFETINPATKAVLARGGHYQIMAGPEHFQRYVLIEFPTFERAVACFESKEYREAAAHRRQNGVGEVENVIVEGGDATRR